jgi:hypothetical protein
MHKEMKSYLLLLLFILFGLYSKAQNVGINASGATPNSAAMLDIDVSSATLTTKLGLLIPRMTYAQKIAIVIPAGGAQGLLVYQTDAPVGYPQGFYYNTSTTTTATWVYVTSSGWQ